MPTASSASASMSGASTARSTPSSPARARRGEPFDIDRFFGRQATPTADLPDPAPLLENLARCVVEVLGGARELEQLARWVSEDVYRGILRRSVLAQRARTLSGAPVARPVLRIGSVVVTSPRDGVIEGVVVAHSRRRARAVAIRLEGVDRRWRAVAIHVL
ncbi:Rv3235 family protein [Labedella endophytica]|uniref:Rv3235 family protein n=1 Tax=Labedella endophytica TaxID=1523160 RepID=UPI001FB5B806|nr:Rv3235 family protein [Labedella endophytica]